MHIKPFSPGILNNFILRVYIRAIPLVKVGVGGMLEFFLDPLLPQLKLYQPIHLITPCNWNLYKTPSMETPWTPLPAPFFINFQPTPYFLK